MLLVIAERMMRRLSIVMMATLATAVLTGCSNDPQQAAKEALEKGNLHAQNNKYPEAIIEYRRAVQSDPRLGEARLQLAYAYASTGDGINAMREYVRAADLMPESKEAQQRAGAFMLLAGQFNDAQGLAERMLKRNPNDVEGHILLANALAGLKDMDGAVSAFEKAVELDPNRSSTYSELGSVHMVSGNKESADAAFQKAIQIDPKNAGAHFSYSNFLWATGDLPRAEQEMKTGLALEPKSVTGNRAMAMYYMVTNQAPRRSRT